MNVRIALERSFAETETLDALTRIVQAIGDGWHEWVGPDPGEPVVKPYLERFAHHAELLQKSYTRAALYPLESRRTIVVGEEREVAVPPRALAAETTVSASVAAVLLTQPLGVLVENEINDGAFFKRLLETIDPELVGWFGEARPRVRFENGGGKAVVRAQVAHRGQAAVATGVPLRLLVLIDSDSRFPGDPGKDTVATTNACAEAGASLFVLAKRAIENYVTDAVLEDYARGNPDLASAIAFVLALAPEARDHYPIKRGIPVEDSHKLLPAEKTVYSDISFPSPKVPRAAARFTGSPRPHSESDLEKRGCLQETQALARWIREEML